MTRCANPNCRREIRDHEDRYRDHSMRTFCKDCFKAWKESQR